jgi:transposase-like protein
MGSAVSKAMDWVEANIEQTLTFYRLPRQHHKNLKSTNLLERLNEEIRRRTLVARIFPNTAACLRLIRALAVETHENWIQAIRCLNMDSRPAGPVRSEFGARMGTRSSGSR